MESFHQPVLLKEALTYLNARPGKKYVDATVGGGGHTAAILEKGGVVLGIDTDPEAVSFVKKHFAAELRVKRSASGDAKNLEKLKVVQGNFKNIGEIAKKNNFYPVAGVLYDLGLSSYQLEHSGRGFSFQKDEPLDMRADPDLKVTAANLINGLSENELFKLFQKYGEERQAKRFALSIIQARSVRKIETSKELADLLVGSARKRGTLRGKTRIHPATKVFQALRIAVNDELNNLQSSLPQAFELLEPARLDSASRGEARRGGRLMVISFHSLEDSIVKNAFLASGGKILTERPVTPSLEEVQRNFRARSARMRVVEKR